MIPENNLFFPPHLPPHRRGRKPAPILSHHEAKKSRRVVPYTANRAPSLSSYNNLHESIKEHAFLRVQLFVTRAKLFEGQAVKSDGTLHNVHFAPGHAHQQQGMSHSKGRHAAHANECAGMKENIKEQWLLDIEKHGVITPRKKKNFRQRGVSENDINAMEQSLVQGIKVRKALSDLMPGPGFLDHTQADDLLNATDLLPQEVNLQVDKVLEDRIREKSAELNEKVAKSLITVKNATEQYIQSARNIFNEYKKEMKAEHATQKFQWQKLRLERLMMYVDDELSGTVMPPDFMF